jgi:hypothetical protein
MVIMVLFIAPNAYDHHLHTFQHRPASALRERAPLISTLELTQATTTVMV